MVVRVSELVRCLTQFDADVVGADTTPHAVGQEDVLWLQVSVDDAFAPQDAHGSRYLLEEAPDGVLTQGTSGWKDKKKHLARNCVNFSWYSSPTKRSALFLKIICGENK